ncbi:hypothetical protein ES708_04963 [subsurface metagenome]
MDLKDVISDVYAWAGEAHSAFHAGHHDKAEECLKDIGAEIGTYLDEKPTPAGNVTESATSEKPGETLPETQAKVSGPGVQPAVIDPAAPASEVLPASQFEKPIQ